MTLEKSPNYREVDNCTNCILCTSRGPDWIECEKYGLVDEGYICDEYQDNGDER